MLLQSRVPTIWDFSKLFNDTFPRLAPTACLLSAGSRQRGTPELGSKVLERTVRMEFIVHRHSLFLCEILQRKYIDDTPQEENRVQLTRALPASHFRVVVPPLVSGGDGLWERPALPLTAGTARTVGM